MVHSTYCNDVCKTPIGQTSGEDGHLARTAIWLNVIRYGFNSVHGFRCLEIGAKMFHATHYTMMSEHLRGKIAAARYLLQCAPEHILVIIDILW